MSNLSGVALVTGAGTGIGRAISVALAKEGCSVALAGRNSASLAETKTIIEGSSCIARPFHADLRDSTSIGSLVAAVNAELGAISILVNCAGVWHDSSRAYYGCDLHEISVEELDDVLDVGVRAPMLLAKAVLPDMIASGQGKIVNVSGTFSSGGAGWLHYYVSKKALEDFTVGLADELRKHKIQVNCISPADVKTPALKKFFQDDYITALDPGDVARYAVFLASEQSDHITGSCTVLRNKAVGT